MNRRSLLILLPRLLRPQRLNHSHKGVQWETRSHRINNQVAYLDNVSHTPCPQGVIWEQIVHSCTRMIQLRASQHLRHQKTLHARKGGQNAGGRKILQSQPSSSQQKPIPAPTIKMFRVGPDRHGQLRPLSSRLTPDPQAGAEERYPTWGVSSHPIYFNDSLPRTMTVSFEIHHPEPPIVQGTKERYVQDIQNFPKY